MSVAIRRARLADVDGIKKLAQRHSDELGFVMKCTIEQGIGRGELLVAAADDEVVGFANTHRRRDGVTVLYELAVAEEHRHQGIAKQLLGVMGRPLVAKCPAKLPSNKFYLRVGFRLVETVRGKSRTLNVWRLA